MKYFKFPLTLIILFFLMAPLSSGSWAAETENDYIKVGLKYGNSAVDACTISSEEGFILGTIDGSGFIEGMPLPGYTSVVASEEHGIIVLRDENGIMLSSDLSDSTCIMPANYRNEGIIKLGVTPYRGGIILHENGSGKLNVINYLSLEHYVSGVLNAEIYHTNPMEALKAQAVVARSFGGACKGIHTNDGFDVCQTTHCQVYVGYKGEYEETNKAVYETSGQMIYSQGKPVITYYFKNSGGHTQNVEDVWSGSKPYLIGVNDEYSPSYPWTISLTFDTIKQKLEASGYSPGQIKSVAIKSRNINGSVADLEIVGSNETVHLLKERTRYVLGTSTVKSLMFGLGNEAPALIRSDYNLIASNGMNCIDLGNDVYIISGEGEITKQQTSTIYCGNGSSSVKLQGVNTYAEDAIVTGGTVTFSGLGYGHGIGMPQDSAIEMAKLGITYDEILKKYYTNIEIK